MGKDMAVYVGSTTGTRWDCTLSMSRYLLRCLLSNQHKQPYLFPSHHQQSYRGVEVNVMRACILNATKMGVYDMTKGIVTEKTGWSRKDARTSFASAFVAGFFMTVTVAPADMIRTKLMNQPTDAKLYDGFVDCAKKTIQEGGVTSLWRGFIPIWARFAPQATLQLMTIEIIYKKMGFAGI